MRDKVTPICPECDVPIPDAVDTERKVAFGEVAADDAAVAIDGQRQDLGQFDVEIIDRHPLTGTVTNSLNRALVIRFVVPQIGVTSHELGLELIEILVDLGLGEEGDGGLRSRPCRDRIETIEKLRRDTRAAKRILEFVIRKGYWRFRPAEKPESNDRQHHEDTGHFHFQHRLASAHISNVHPSSGFATRNATEFDEAIPETSFFTATARKPFSRGSHITLVIPAEIGDNRAMDHNTTPVAADPTPAAPRLAIGLVLRKVAERFFDVEASICNDRKFHGPPDAVALT